VFDFFFVSTNQGNIITIYLIYLRNICIQR